MQTSPETPKKTRHRLTLDERITAAQERLTAKEAEREELAKRLRSLKASKMNKDRNAERKKRSHLLILLGLKYERLLFNNSITFITNAIIATTKNKKALEKELAETEDKKEQKDLKKEITDTEIILARLNEIKTEKETPPKDSNTQTIDTNRNQN